MKKFLTRVATGAVFAITLLASILYSKVSFGALFLLVTLLSVNEFCSIVKRYKGTTFSTWLAVLGGGYLYFATFMVFHGAIENTMAIYSPYIAVVAYIFIRQLFDTESKPLDNYAYFALSQIYVAAPLALLNILATGGAEAGNTYSWLLPITIFLFIWCNDTGAFFVGCTIGKHKMFERVSPKKTWEGFIGGLRDIGYKGSLCFVTFRVMEVTPKPVWPEMLRTITAMGNYFKARVEAPEEAEK
jgi:phosphatidate cytidylyltransferase